MSFLGQDTAFLDTTISAATLAFHVTDWDARATETTETDLALDTDPTKVAVGESGLPAFSICIPGVTGDATSSVDFDPGVDVLDDDTPYGGDAGQDSGAAGDPLLYEKLITESITSGQAPGFYTGLARATDAEVPNITDPLFVIELDGTLAPLTSNQPSPVSYAAFVAEVSVANTPPSAAVSRTSPSPMNSGTSAAILVAGITDAEGNPLDISVDWGNGGGFVTIVTGLMPPYANQTPTGPQMNNADLISDVINMTVRIDDGIAPPVDYPLSYTLGPNRAPVVTGTPQLSPSSVLTPAVFNMVQGTATATDPEGDTITLFTINNRNGDTPSGSFTFPYAPNTTAITNPPHVNVTFTVYATDALHPGISGTAYPNVLGTVTAPSSGIGWVYTATTTTTGVDEVYSLAVDSAGNVYGVGSYPNTAPGIDLGGGPRAQAANAQFMFKINGATGAYLWDRTWNSASTGGRPWGVDMDATDNIYVGVAWAGTLNIAALGGGAANQLSGGGQDIGILKFNTSGDYLGMARSNEVVDHSMETPPSTLLTGGNQGILGRGLHVDDSTGAVYLASSPFSTGASTVTVGGIVAPIGGAREPIIARFNGAAFLADASTPAVWVTSIVATAATTINQRIQALTQMGPGGNLVISGSYDGLTDFGDAAVGVAGSTDVYLVQRNAVTGAHVPGTQLAFGSAGLDHAHGLVANASNIWVSGGFATSTGQSITVAPLPAFVSTGAQEGYVICLTPAMVPVWGRHLATVLTSGPEHLFGGVALAGSDLYVFGAIGSQTQGANIGYGPIIPALSNDWYLGKFEAATGNLTGWQKSWAGGPASSFDNPLTLTVSGAHPIIVGRMQIGSGCDFDPGPGVETRPSMQTTDWAVVKVNGATGEF